VEIPFWSTTPTRVPAGTVILSMEPVRRAATGLGATGGGAPVCGPSGCWAAQDALTASRPAIKHRYWEILRGSCSFTTPSAMLDAMHQEVILDA